MNISELENIISSNQIPDISKRFELKAMTDKYPYFQAGIFIYLKCLYIADDEMFRSELQRLSMFVNDRKALFYYVLKEQYERFFITKGNENIRNKSRTDILLNAFFETLDDNAIDLQLNQLSSHPDLGSVGYFEYSAKDTDKKELTELKESNVPLKHQGIIDRFINDYADNEIIRIKPTRENSKEYSDYLTSGHEPSDSKELDDDLFFTETLAHIYIKQHKYERAYEIIKRLSLNYPEKNIYFANQISFLEKLIINSKVKNK